MLISKGMKAPEFTLYDSDKNKVSLADYAGKKNVLLLFFPLAFTSVCTKELCAVRDDIGNYVNAQAQVFGISVDSIYTLAKFKEEQQLNYPLLSDFNKKASLLFGCLYESFSPMEMNGVSKRSGFIIDRAGIIKYAEVLENPTEVPDFETIINELKRLST